MKTKSFEARYFRWMKAAGIFAENLENHPPCFVERRFWLDRYMRASAKTARAYSNLQAFENGNVVANGLCYHLIRPLDEERRKQSSERYAIKGK